MEITYKQFRQTVAIASGQFSCIVFGMRFTTDPTIYYARNFADPAAARRGDLEVK